VDGWKWFDRFVLFKSIKASEIEKQQTANRIIQAVEIERSRISRELHDSIGQALYSVLIGVKIVSQLKVDESVREHFLQVENLTAKALEEVKRISHDLHPSTLDDLGLIPSIRVYLGQFEYTFGIRTKFNHCDNFRRYNKDTEIALYRICQEALTNAAKYAQTPEVEVSFLEETTSVRLIIQDFGQGFQVKQYDDNAKTEGIGLISIRERANSLGGKALIHSQPDKGTSVEVTIPIKNM